MSLLVLCLGEVGVQGGGAPEDVISVEAPAGVHVIEHVRSTLLPEMAAKRGDFGARLIRQLTA